MPTVAEFGQERRNDWTTQVLRVLLVVSWGVVGPGWSSIASAQNPVAVENQQPGSAAWHLSSTASDVSQQIKGYASATSVNKGDPISFYVTVNPAQTYTLDVYRMGWYQGLGGRLLQHIGPLSGFQQPACPVDASTGIIQCNWTSGYTLSVPTTWTSGVFLVKLTNAQGYQNFITFVVRDDARSADILYQASVTTYQAYNNYPNDSTTGKSLYEYNSFGASTLAGTSRAVKVSFDRPYANDGSGQFLSYEVYFVRWLEHAGYDVAYATDLDTHQNSARLLSHKAFLSVGHDEYWSKPMYDGVEQARDAGVHLGFFGANEVYWQVRFEASPLTGAADRVMVCYKDGALDPVHGPTTTVLWRDALLSRSEQRLVGVQYFGTLNGQPAVPYVATNTSNWVYAGTGMANGDSIPAIEGVEVDSSQSNYPLPTAIIGTHTVLSQSPVASSNGFVNAAASVYQAPSGAWVFGAGTITWSEGLDKVGVVDTRIQQMTTNVLTRFLGTVSPTVAQPASATPNPVTGTTTTLSVLGADDGGEANLTYTWATTGTPPAAVAFSANGSNAAKSTVATFTKAGAYSFQVTIRDQNNLPVTSAVNVTVAQTLTSITVAPASASVQVGATQQFTATPADQFATAIEPPPTVGWAVSGGGSISTTGLFTAGAAAGGPYTVTASSGPVNGSASVTVTTTVPPPPSGLVAAYNFEEANGATVLDVSGTGNTGTIFNAIRTAGKYGQGLSFNGTTAYVRVPDAPSLDLTASGTVSAWVSQTTIKSWAGVVHKGELASFSDEAYSLQFNGTTGRPEFYVSSTSASKGTTAAAALSPATAWHHIAATWDATGVKIYVDGVLAGSTAGAITAMNSAGALFFGSQFPGAFQFIGLMDNVRLYNRALASSEIQVDMTTPVAGGNAAPTVPQPASATPNPVTGTTTTLSVLGADDGGEANLTYTWATTGTPPAAVAFSANGTNAAKSTVATFTKAGAYSFQVTITDQGALTATSAVNVTVTQTLTSVTVGPANASVSSGATQQFTATAADQFATAIAPPPTVGWTVSGGGTISTTGLFTAGAIPGGPHTVTASSSGVNGIASVSVTAVAPTVAQPAAATPSPVTGTTTTLSVLGADDGGEANLTYTWGTTGTPPAAVAFSANGTNAAKSTVATFTKAGAYSFQVTIQDQNNLTVISAANVTVAQTLTSLTVAPASVSVQAGATQQFAATAADQFATAIAPPPIVGWAVSGGGSISTTGLFTAGVIGGGPFTVTASSGPVNGTASVTVTAVAPTVAQPAAATPNPVTGTTTTLSVLGADDGGEANLTYTWATTGTPPAAVAFSANGTNAAKSTVATFTKAGAYSLQVTIRDQNNLPVTSAINVTVAQTLTSITVAPASASVSSGTAQQFTATAADQFATAIAPPPTVEWAVSGGGSISTTGLFTAGSIGGGPFTVTASSGPVNGTASVTVTAVAPTVAQPAAATPSPVTGTTTTLSVLGADDGGEANLTYTWATTGTPPAAVAFSANGTNAAKSMVATFTKAGAYSLQVTIRDQNNLPVISAVNVTVAQTLTSITVAPASASVQAGATQQFTATPADQFGTAIAPPPSVGWGASGGGTISPTGLFTAGAAAGGPYTVTASSGSVNGTASVTVTAAPPPPSGLVAAYNFEEANGATVLDASGTGNTGTIFNATRTAGKYGQGLSFNGTTAYVRVPDAPSLDLTASGTVSAWVSQTTIKSWAGLVHKGELATFSDEAYSLQFNGTTGQPVLYVNSTSASKAATAAAALSPATAWHHIAATWDATGLKMYIDGVLVGSTTGAITAMDSSGALFFGSQFPGAFQFIGLMDNVRLYNRALASSEIQVDMTTPVGP